MVAFCHDSEQVVSFFFDNEFWKKNLKFKFKKLIRIFYLNLLNTFDVK